MRSWILVVEEPFVADSLAAYLRLMREEYDVETAHSTASAMLEQEHREFSLALVKLSLPDGSGLCLLRQLKRKNPSLEVIITTGGGNLLPEATRQGAFYVLLKPFDLDAMLILVGKALERRRLVAENSDLRRKLAERSGHNPIDVTEADGTRSRILVVCGQPDVADNVRLILERQRYEVETAGSAASATLCMAGREFSLAFVDLVLRDQDGLALLRLLKREHPSLEVIVMTDTSSVAKAVEATTHGAFYFLTSPLDSAEVVILASRALERRCLVAENSELRRKLAEQAGHGLTHLPET